jgi:hypothetical protein
VFNLKIFIIFFKIFLRKTHECNYKRQIKFLNVTFFYLRAKSSNFGQSDAFDVLVFLRTTDTKRVILAKGPKVRLCQTKNAFDAIFHFENFFGGNFK